MRQHWPPWAPQSIPWRPAHRSPSPGRTQSRSAVPRARQTTPRPPGDAPMRARIAPAPSRRDRQSGSTSPWRAATARMNSTATAPRSRGSRSSFPPVLAHLVDLFAERVELLVAPRFLLEEGCGRLAGGAAEEHAHQLADGLLLRGCPRRHRRIDVAKTLGAMPDHAFRLELGEHGADRGIGRRLAQFLADCLGVGVIAERIEDVHDFAFAAAEFLHVLRTEHSATNVARQVGRRSLLGRTSAGLLAR